MKQNVEEHKQEFRKKIEEAEKDKKDEHKTKFLKGHEAP